MVQPQFTLQVANCAAPFPSPPAAQVFPATTSVGATTLPASDAAAAAGAAEGEASGSAASAAAAVDAPPVDAGPAGAEPAAAAAAAPPGPPKGTDPEIKAAFELQNKLRARHGVPPLAWDAGLAADGARYAAGCPMDHSTEWSGRGENLAWMFPKFTDAVKAWYDEASTAVVPTARREPGWGTGSGSG
jgi:uncharacterized protein YkwD